MEAAMELMDDLVAVFVDETCGLLRTIESALRAMAPGDTEPDETQANTMLRAVLAIKSGAGCLGLVNIHDLAHKLGGLLSMLGNREILVEARVIDGLLAGFDRLVELVGSAADSEAQDVGDVLGTLSRLMAEQLSPRQLALAATTVPLALPGGEVALAEDALTLRQASAGGKNLYLVEYDLGRDIQARGKTPFDILRAMESSGQVVDCRLAPGDEAGRRPLYVLFASVVDPDIISYLCVLDDSRIHRLDPAALSAEPAAEGEAGEAGPEIIGPWQLVVSETGVSLALTPGAIPDAAEARLALLAGLEHGRPVEMVWPESVEVDLALVQVVVSAAMTLVRRGLPLTHRGGPPAALSRLAVRAGIGPHGLAAVGLPPATLLRETDAC